MKARVRKRRQRRLYCLEPLRLKPLVAAVAAVASGLSTGMAAAATDEVLVTATRRATAVQDIPLNIAAVTGEQLEQLRVNNLADIALLVPGLSVAYQGGRGASLMTVRGLNVSSLNASEFLDNTSGDTVAIYVGEIPLYIDLKPYDLERVEVLIGPQGTLYGAGTLAGAVRYIPRKPGTDRFDAEVHARTLVMSHSSDVGYEADAMVNVPLVDGRLAFRGVFGYEDRPGFIDYNYLVREAGVSNPQPDFSNKAEVADNLTQKRDANDLQTTFVRGSLLWNPTDWVEATLSYLYQRQEAGGRTVNHRFSFNDDILGVPGAGAGRYVSAYRFVEPNDRKNQLASLEIVADLGFADLVSATGYSWYDEVGQRDQTDLLLNFEYGYEAFPSFAAFTREDFEEDRTSQEFRLVSKSDSRWNWIVGAFYNKFEQDAISDEFVPGIPEFFGIDRPDNLEYRQLTEDELTEQAVFGEIGYQITDQWQVTVGARWFSYDNDSNVCFALPLIDGSAPDEILLDCQANSVDDDDVIFKFNTSYDFRPGFKAYLTISEGYRIGGVNSVPPCLDPLPPGQNVCALPNEVLIKPDTTLNTEIGLRTSWLDNRLIINGAVYRIEWDDIQTESITVNGGIPITVNGGEARSKGVEIAAELQVNEHWRVGAAYAYTSAELTENAPLLVDGVADGEAGDRLPGTPRQQFNALINYTTALTPDMRFDFDYRLAAISDVYTKVGLRNDGDILGGYALHNLAASLSGERWTAALFCDNCTDKFAETAARRNQNQIKKIPDPAVPGDPVWDLRQYHRDVIEPRTIGVELRYRFGG